MGEMTLEDIAEKMRDIDFAVLVTRSDGGALAGRPMSNNRDVDYDGDAWFFALEETRTISDIRRDPNVALSYQAKGGLLKLKPFFLAVEGRAELIRDRDSFARHWNADLDAWFDQGVDTPGLVLIRVGAERIHYWNGGDEGELMLAGHSATAGG